MRICLDVLAHADVKLASTKSAYTECNYSTLQHRFFILKFYNCFCLLLKYTRIKISQLVASLQTSRQQVVFARLVTSCQQVWNKLLTTCNNLVDIIRLVTRFFQQGCYNHDITILLQPCVVNLAPPMLRS